MSLYCSISVNLILVSGFFLVISDSMVFGQSTLQRSKRQFDSTPPWAEGFFSNPNRTFEQLVSNFGDGGNITKNVTYKSVVRKVIKMPDGSVKTEEISHNSNPGEIPSPFSSSIDDEDNNKFLQSALSNSNLSGLSDIASLFFKQFSKPGKIVDSQPENLCPPLTSENVDVRCQFQGQGVSCQSSMRPGTIATQQCYQYYKPAYDSVQSRLTCLQNGRWDSYLTYCIPVCGSSKEIGINTPLIVDGRPANIGSFPWHAGLYMRVERNGQDFWDQQCGGTLISDQFILTAAHCVANLDEKDVRVALGKFFRPWDQYEETEQKRNVAKITYPPEFHKSTLYFDIALLLLDRKVDMGQYVTPVCSSLLDGSHNILNKKLYIVGWGRTVNVLGGSSSNTLLYNDVKFVPPNACQRLIPVSYSLFDKFCTLKKDDAEVSIAQQGDSGGGLTAVFDGLHYIFGIVSGKLNQVTTFTNITWPTHTTWMENEMRKYDQNFRG